MTKKFLLLLTSIPFAQDNCTIHIYYHLSNLSEDMAISIPIGDSGADILLDTPFPSFTEKTITAEKNSIITNNYSLKSKEKRSIVENIVLSGCDIQSVTLSTQGVNTYVKIYENGLLFGYTIPKKSLGNEINTIKENQKEQD